MKNRRLSKKAWRKYQRELAAVTLAVILIGTVIGERAWGPEAYAATYTFTQTSWSGGTSASSGAHPANEAGWTTYSTSTTITAANAGADLQLATSSATITQTDDSNSNTGFNLSGTVFSSTTLSGTGAAASVKLALQGAAFATTTIDTSASINDYSIALGPDGFARVLIASGVNLYFIQCTNASCSAKTTTYIGGLSSGGSAAMVLAADGFARVAYQDLSSVGYIQCTNATCSTKATSTVDAVVVGGWGLSMTIAPDGFARIVYTSSSTNQGVRYTQCLNARCSSAVTTTIEPNGSANYRPAIAIGQDGYPRITYANTASQRYKFVRCANDSCSSVSSTTLDRYSYPDTQAAIAVGSDGLVRYVMTASTYFPTFGVCGNADCTSQSTSTIEAAGQSTSPFRPKFILTSGNLGQILYRDGSTFRTHLVQCQNASCSSSTITNIGPSGGYPTDIMFGSDGYLRGVFYGGTTLRTTFIYALNTYAAAGTYASGPVDPGFTPPAWGTLSWTQSGSGTVTLKARSSATPDFGSAPDWSSCANIASGGALSTGNCVTDGQRYLQYQASLSTSDTAVTPSLDAVVLGYVQYAGSGSLTSSAYDSGDPANVMGGIAWDEDASLPAGSAVTVSLRAASSSALLSSAAWTDFTNHTADCSKSGASVTCTVAALPDAFKDSQGDEWFEYKVALTGTGAASPTVGEVRVVFVVNVAPQFNPDYPSSAAGGAGASQIQATDDPDLGRVEIKYAVRDPDTLSGSAANRGKVLPSFEYNTGGGWNAISPEYLSSGAVSEVTVDEAAYASYTVIWNAAAEAPGTYSSGTRIRVTVNDREAANNIASATTAMFPLDTRPPALASGTFDGAANELSFAVTDNNSFHYQVANEYPIPSSTPWVEGSPSAAIAWTPGGGTGPQSIYLAFKDAYGNQSSSTIVAPGAPQNFDIRDISNSQTADWREFLSWKNYTATSGAAFGSYEVYRSTNNSTFNLIATITDPNSNFYTDANVGAATLYYYKIAATDADGDRSGFSTVVSDAVDGQGGTDFTPPVISDAAAAETQTTWARITWNTDEISDSEVDYSVSSSTDFGTSVTSAALTTAHSVVLSGLLPDTTYLFRVRSRDIFNNQAEDDNRGAGYSITTGGGPVITDVTAQSVGDTQALISWNTDRSSDSAVVYGTDLDEVRTGSNVMEAVDTAMVGSPFQHLLRLSGLSLSTRYYFYVKSTAAESGYESIDNNNGAYYYLQTTHDTKPPVISGITVPVIAQTSASVVWQTDELADAGVDYGTVSGSYPDTSSVDPTLSIYHVLSINGLTPGTTYYLQVRSADASGNQADGAEVSFKTAAAGEAVTVLNVITNTTPPVPAAEAPKKDTAPPVISNIEVRDTDAFSATIAFSTDEAAVAFVRFGETGYDSTGGSSDLGRDHVVRLTHLRPGTTYHFGVEALDVAGNSARSKDQTFATKYLAEELEGLAKLDNVEQLQSQLDDLIQSTLPSLIPPVTSDVEITDVAETSAAVTWTTNVKTYGSVALAEDAAWNAAAPAYPSELGDTRDKTASHKVLLTNLVPGTKYHIQTRSFALPGLVGKGKDRTFTTSASKIKPQIIKSGNDSFTVAWQTPMQTTSRVEYKDLKSGKVAQVGTDESPSTSHAVDVQNLVPDTTYSVRVFGYDRNNILVEGSEIRVATKRDVTAPEISAVAISNAFVPYRPNQLQTIVSWKTDELANSAVNFEEGVGVSGNLANSAGSGDFTTEHVVILSSFKPGTVYRIKIASTDTAGNTTVLPVRTIITPASNQSVFDVIVKNFEDSFGFLNNINK